MGQVLGAGCVGVAGYGMLQLAWLIWKLLGYFSTRPVGDNPRLRAMAENKSGEEYVQAIAELATKKASEAARAAEQIVKLRGRREGKRLSEQSVAHHRLVCSGTVALGPVPDVWTKLGEKPTDFGSRPRKLCTIPSKSPEG